MAIFNKNKKDKKQTKTNSIENDYLFDNNLFIDNASYSDLTPNETVETDNKASSFENVTSIDYKNILIDEEIGDLNEEHAETLKEQQPYNINQVTEQVAEEIVEEQADAEEEIVAIDNQTEDSEENIELNEEVKKYETELLSTKQKLEQYLSKFSQDYLDDIRKTDYYKERLAYWTDYYAKRRKEAEIKDQKNNLARNEAMKQNNDNQVVKTTKENITENSGYLQLSEEEQKNINNISKADLFITQIDNRLGNYTVSAENNLNQTKKADETIKETKIEEKSEQKAETKSEEKTHNTATDTTDATSSALKEKVEKYVTKVLLDSMKNNLTTERDDIRNIIDNLNKKPSLVKSHIASQYNEKYNIYNDALASFENVYKNGYNESKRAVAKRQRNSVNFADRPDIMMANDMLVDNLRTTFVEEMTKYISGRIISQIEKQNLQDTVVIDDKSTKSLIKQIMTSANNDFVAQQNTIKENAGNIINHLQDECKQLEETSKDQSLSAQERKLAKDKLKEQKYNLEYQKTNLNNILKKQEKLLNRNSFDYIMNRAFSSEIINIMSKNASNKLEEYNINEEKTTQMAKNVVEVLEKSKDATLIFKQKSVVKSKATEKVEVEEKVEQQKVIQPQVQPEKTIETKQKITREQFIDDRIEALEGLVYFSKSFENICKQKGNPKEQFFKYEKEELLNEYNHWFAQVESIKIRIDELLKKGEKVPAEYYDFYNENYIPEHNKYKDSIEQCVSNYMDRCENIEDNGKTLSTFMAISDDKFVDCIKNEEVRNAVSNLKNSLSNLNQNIFMQEYSEQWNKILESQKNSDLVAEGIIDIRYITLTQEKLNENIKYYNQEAEEEMLNIEQNLVELEKHRELLNKLEETAKKLKEEAVEEVL